MSVQTHTVQKVIVTKTEHDFVDLTIKRLATKISKAVAGLAVATAAVQGSAAPATATPADASTLTTTFHHPFYDITQAAFVDAVDPRPGDQLRTADGTTAEVASVRAYRQTETTYDLTIGGLHTYHVDAGGADVLVHNCGEGEAGLGTSQQLADRASVYHAKIQGKAGDFSTSEQKALLDINAQEGWAPVAGGTSRSVCSAVCAALIRATGGKISGRVYPRENGAKIRTFHWPSNNG